MNNFPKLSCITLILAGCFVGLLFGLSDLVVFTLSEYPLTSEELFLLTFGFLHLTFFSYMLIFFIPLGALCGLLGCLLQKCRLRLFERYGARSHILLYALMLFLIVSAMRVYTGDQISKVLLSIMYLFVIFVISFALFILLERLLSNSRIVKARGRQYNLLFGILLAMVVISSLAAPLLYGPIIESQFRAENPKTKVPNVLVIVMDTVRADHLSCYGYQRTTTPNVDNVAKEGALFLKAISPAPWTLPAHASMFTGLYPSQHRADWGHQQLDSSFLTLAEHLKSKGYKTVAFWENPWAGGSPDQGLSQGFEDFYPMYLYPYLSIELRVMNKFRKIFFSYKDTKEYTEDTVVQAKKWILRKNSYGTGQEPFFMFINFIVAHTPNYPRSDIIRKFATINWTEQDLMRIEPVNVKPEVFYLPHYALNQRELEIMKTIYDGEIAYLDMKIGELLSFLRERNVLDNTLLIITSDHGENFGDHGYIEHQFCLYNTLLHVPLLIRYPPKIEPGKIIRERVSTIFLFQTILDVIGDQASALPSLVERRSLFETGEERDSFAEYGNAVGMLKDTIGDKASDFDYKPFDRSLRAIYTGDYKFIWSSNGNHELFNVAEDWDEKENLFEKERKKYSELENRLTNWQASLWKPAFAKEPVRIDESAKKALRSLGYTK